MADGKRMLIERLFAHHRAALQAFFYRRVKAKDDTADLVQEVYLRMLRVSHLESIRSPEPPAVATSTDGRPISAP